MEKYESKIKVVKGSTEAIYAHLSDLSRVNGMIPAEVGDKLKDAQATADECSFTVDKLGRVAIAIAERQPCSLVKYVLKAAMPLGVNIFVQIKEAPQPTVEPESRIKVSLTADIPLMLRPLVGSKLQGVVDQVAETLSHKTF